MFLRLWILGMTAVVVTHELSGDHICEIEKSFPVNVTEFTLKNVTLRNYQWCMSYPPRCSFYTFKTVRIPKIVETYETKTVQTCCPGYAENQNHDGCVPCGKCFEGTCGTEGRCICNAGFHGIDCADACEPMHWGIDCKFDCFCKHGSCDPRTGRCNCPAGWFGTRCDLLCLEGFYGKNCMHRCNCGERDLCSAETGECFGKSTQHQEHHSTRAIHYMTEDLFNITQIINRQKSTPSLKKYHTFDSEISFTGPTPSNTIRWTTASYPSKTRGWTTVPYPSKTREKVTNSYRPRILSPKANGASSHETTKKKLGSTKIASEEHQDSYESTTEMSEEVVRDVDSLPIVNEDGSLETNDSNWIKARPTKMTYSQESSPQLISNVFHGDKKVNVMSPKKSSREYSSKETKVFSLNDRVSGKKGTSTLSREATTIKHTDYDATKITTHAEKTLSNTKIKDNKSIKEKIFANGISTKTYPNSRNISDGKSTHKGIHISTTKRKEEKMTTNLPSSVGRTVSVRTPRKYLQTSSITTSSRSNTDVNTQQVPVTNNPSILRHTSPIPKVHKTNRKTEKPIVEEDKLQNLDSFNFLTSEETVTPVIDSMTTVESIIIGKRVLPVTVAAVATRSFRDNIGNDVSSESMENQTPLKEAFDYPRSKEENDIRDEEGSVESEFSTTEKNSLTTNVTITALVCFILVIIMSVIIMVDQYARKRKKREPKLRSELHQNHPGGPTVAVYTHSIFHSPLPDPPTFENPVFTAPSENLTDHRTFQTHVVCSLNFPANHRTDDKEYTYDHPPSTGSYRAASIPEPPDINEPVTTEPVYDEIPSMQNRRMDAAVSPPPSYKSSCIYVNTSGKTRL